MKWMNSLLALGWSLLLLLLPLLLLPLLLLRLLTCASLLPAPPARL